MVKSPPVKSADRALAVLALLADQGGASFTELLTALELPRSSASGLLATLESGGWIERDDLRRYRVGLRAWQVGRRYRGHDDLARIAGPVMEELTRRTRETVQLARLDGVENIYIAISPSPHPMRLASSIGERLPSTATGIGKALLAQLDPAERERRLRRAPLPRLTARTITDLPRLLRVLDRAATDGYARDDEEYVEGCRCVAVPLHTDDLGVVTAMSVTAPVQRAGDDWVERTLPELRRAADELRDRLGLD
jgi:DNA-binding IclR family transcriptional regulator